jgi:hypothetical protein
MSCFDKLLGKLKEIKEDIVSLEVVLDCTSEVEVSEEDMGFLEVVIRGTMMPEYIAVESLICEATRSEIRYSICEVRNET